MPLDIDIKQNEYHVTVQFCKVTELIAAVHMLADKGHQGFDAAWQQHVMQHLSPQSQELLKHLSRLNFPGLELFDFITLEKAYEDIAAFIDRMKGYDSLDFLYVMLDKMITKEQLLSAQKDKAALDSIKDSIPWVLKGSEDYLDYMFADAAGYKDKVIALLTEIYDSGFESKLTELQERYLDAMDAVGHRLKGRNPVELAEEIKGSKFTSKNNFKEYIFSPSYFFHHHNIISYNESIFLMIFNINIDNSFDDGEAERLSELLKVLSDKTRLEILRQLKRRPTYGRVLSSRLNLTTATISRHLDQLKAINLIREEKKNNVKYYYVNGAEVERLFDEIREFLNKR